jgi:hypothetical protein
MAFVVGILLMKLPEEQAFATLSAIMVEPLYDMRGVYDASVGKMPFFFFDGGANAPPPGFFANARRAQGGGEAIEGAFGCWCRCGCGCG